MVDGVYDKDPHKYEDAVRYSRLTFSDVLGSASAGYGQHSRIHVP